MQEQAEAVHQHELGLGLSSLHDRRERLKAAGVHIARRELRLARFPELSDDGWASRLRRMFRL